MSILLETLIYLLLIFAFIMLTTTVFNKNLCVCQDKDRYIRSKHKDINIEAKIIISGINEYEKIKILDIIERGEFSNIYDIVDTVEIIEKQEGSAGGV